jgi:hypothetical protein
VFKDLNAKRRGYYRDDGGHGNAPSRQPFFTRAMRILFNWLTRRSQRRRYTWTGLTELLRHLRVERPRLVGRPNTRMAALAAEAGLRTRVCLKSPVRANCTPGSVRGRLGNRPSYRDDGNNKTAFFKRRVLLNADCLLGNDDSQLFGGSPEPGSDHRSASTDHS